MRVGVWTDRTDMVYIDVNPLPTDVVIDLPSHILQEYHNRKNEWESIQKEVMQFVRSQDRDDEYENLF